MSLAVLWLVLVQALPSVEAGRAVFESNCAVCHAGDGRNGRAPDLTAHRFRGGDKEEDLIRIVSKGVRGSDMPAWEDDLKAEEIRNVVAFLRAPVDTEARPKGDAAHGESLFWGRGGCGDCHAVNGRGSRVGPDLSGVGRVRNAAYLRETLTKPGTSALSEYRGIEVVTAGGKTVRGIAKLFDDFSVVLVDFNGRAYSFDRTALRSVKPDNLMPVFSREFSDAEVDDIVAWLCEQQGADR